MSGIGDQETNSTCQQFSSKQWHMLSIARTATASTSCLACLTAFILVLVCRAHHRFVHRLTLYLTGAAFFLSVLYALQILPVKLHNGIASTREGWSGLCTAIAFLDQYTGWVMLLIICWINLYLFLLAVTKSSALVNHKRVYEVAGIVTVFILPLTYVWIPFLDDRYGLAGAWCWIKLTKGTCNASYVTGLEFQIGLWYGPAIVITSLSFIGMCALVYALCKQVLKTENNTAQHINALKDAFPLLVYLVIFNFINCLDIVNHIYYAIVTLKEGKDPYFPLWMVNAIAGPGRPLIIPFAFTCGQLRHALNSRKQQTVNVQSSQTAFIVSKEWTEQDPLIITQNRTSA